MPRGVRISVAARVNRAAFITVATLAAIWEMFAAIELTRGTAIADFVSILFVTIGVFTVTAIHEVGHALGALLVRARLRTIYVAPFALDLVTRKIQLVGLVGGRDVGGYVQTQDGLHEIRRIDWIIIVAAGPAGSVVGGLLILVVLNFAGINDPFGITAFAAAIGFGSILAGLVNLWPASVGGFMTDGALIADALRGWRPRRR